jgi:hypothetical protein
MKGVRSMKKWIGPLVSLFLVLALGTGLICDSFRILKKTLPKETRLESYRLVPIQEDKEKGETDPHMIQVLKEIQKKLDGWLKSLNERIENEDVSRFEVRFLEILRNILEWVKEKVDAKIESSEKEKPQKNPKRGIFQETGRQILPLSKLG